MSKSLHLSLAMLMFSALPSAVSAQSVGDVIQSASGDYKAYKVTGENLITNGSFDDGVNGWFNGTWSTAVASDYVISETGGFDGGAYISISAGGASTNTTLRNHAQVEPGKTYLFSCYTGGSAPASNNLQYNALWTSTDGQAEGTRIYDLKWNNGTWTQNTFVFTPEDYTWVCMRNSWTSKAYLDGVFIGEIEEVPNVSLLKSTIDEVNKQIADGEFSTYSETTQNRINKAVEDAALLMNSEDCQAVSSAIVVVKEVVAEAASFDEKIPVLFAEIEKSKLLGVSDADLSVCEEMITDPKNSYNDIMAMLNVLQYNAIGENYTLDASLLIGDVSSWSGDMVTNKSQHWDGSSTSIYYEQSGEKWGSSAWTTYMDTLVTLPAGKYVLKFAGRASAGVSGYMSVNDEKVFVPSKGDVGFGIDVYGKSNFAGDGTYANNNAGRGWEWCFLPFELTEESEVAFKMYAETSTSQQWVSFASVSLCQVYNEESAIFIGKLNLKALISDADAIIEARENVGDALFCIPESAITALSDAVAANQGVLDNGESTLEDVENALTAIQNAIDAYLATPVNAPVQFAEYKLTQVASNLVLSLEDGVKLGEDATVEFESAGENQYYIKSVDGEYVYYSGTGSDSWSMSVSDSRKDAWTITAIGEGVYTLKGKNGFLGTDNTTVGSACYGNKGDDTDRAKWQIAEFPIPDYAIEWKKAKASAMATLADEQYSVVAGVVKANLQTEIAKSKPVDEEGYLAAAKALMDAETAFKAALDVYQSVASQVEIAKAMSADVAEYETLLTSETTTVDELSAPEILESLNVLQYNAANDNYTLDASLLIGDVSSWQGDMVTNKSQHWDGSSTSTYFEQTGDKWGTSAWTTHMDTTVTLPAGKYVLKCTGRASAGVSAYMSVNDEKIYMPSKGDVGFGVDVEGMPNFSEDGIYAFDNAGRGWEWRFLPFELTEETEVAFRIYAETNTSKQWVSFASVSLSQEYNEESAMLIGKLNLEALIGEANAIIEARENVGDALFCISEAALEIFEEATMGQQYVLDNEESTLEEIEGAIDIMKKAIEAYKATPINAPKADAEYIITHTASNLTMSLEDGVKLGENTTVKFEAAGDNTFYITNGNGEYVYYSGTGNDSWSMSVSADNKAAWTITAVGDGTYTIKGKNGFIGTDNTTVGSNCYGNKKDADEMKFWTIEEVAGPQIITPDMFEKVLDVDASYNVYYNSAEEASYKLDIASIAAALQIMDIADVKVYVLNGEGAMIEAPNMGFTNLWFNSNGVACAEDDADAAFYVRISQTFMELMAGQNPNVVKENTDYNAVVYIVSGDKLVAVNIAYNVGVNVGINGISVDNVASAEYYTIDGKQLNAPAKGLNIVVYKMTDGTTKTTKVYIK